MFQTKVLKEIKTHILNSENFYENRAKNEMCGKIWYSRTGMRFACWLIKATDAHS
jgi:hypothetical protein